MTLIQLKVLEVHCELSDSLTRVHRLYLKKNVNVVAI
jgi:hypothetical protein